jgi:hypothetical protein
MKRSIPISYLCLASTMGYYSVAAKFGILDFFGLELLSSGETLVGGLLTMGLTAWGFMLIAGEKWKEDWRIIVAHLLFWGYIAVVTISLLLGFLSGN